MFPQPTTIFLLLTCLAILSVYGQYSVADKTQRLKQLFETNHNPVRQHETDDLISSISNNSELVTAILKFFGLGSEPEILETQFRSTKTINTPMSPKNGIKVAERNVCPFDADPLILSGEYSYCKSTTTGECPAGFVCDLSLALGRTICCQDMRNQPTINIKVKQLTTTPSSNQDIKTTHENSWSSTIANRQSPWYIRGRKPLYGILPNTSSQSLVFSKATTAPTMLFSKLLTTESTADIDSNELSIEDIINRIRSTTERQKTTDRTEFGTSIQSSQKTSSPFPTPPLPTDYSATSVSLIQTGNIKKLTDRKISVVGTITLINDKGYRILVDTGSAADTESLLQGLSKEISSIDEITMVVITSGHPSHTGNLNLFPLKPILFHTMEYVQQNATASELKDRPYRKLTENVEVWKTPGPTQQSLSVLVYDVTGYGTIAIVGDLIPTENYLSNKNNSSVDFDENVWDSSIKRQNSNLIVCLADWIIPGHGQRFRVLPIYRQRAGCTRLLAQQKFRRM